MLTTNTRNRGKPPEAGRELFWLGRQVRRYSVPYSLAVVPLLGATQLSLVDPLIVKWLIDSGLQGRSWTAIISAMVLFCTVYICRSMLLNCGGWRGEVVRQHMTHQLRRSLLRRLQALDAQFFDKHRTGDLVQRLDYDVEEVGHTISYLLPTGARIIVGVTTTLVIMLLLDWRLAACVLPVVPILVCLRLRFRATLEVQSQQNRAALGERASFLHEYLKAIIQFKLLAARGFFGRKLGRLGVRVSRTSLRQRRTELNYHAVSLGVMTLGTAGVLLAGAYEYMRGMITLGGYIAFYSYLMRLFDPLSAAVEVYSRLKRVGGSIRRIVEIQVAEPNVRDEPPARKLPTVVVTRAGCRMLGFGYGSMPVLRDVHLDLVPGCRLALVGRSGSGKSTLAHLLVRLYDPERGSVFLGDQDVRRLRLASLYQHIAFAPSKPAFFRGTVRENALLGRSVREGRDLDNLAWVACFDSVLEKLAHGWDHALGEDGAGLSDGEKQRLGLLRALIADCEVLILDEPTSALDPAIERELLRRLGVHTKGKLVLVITHRPTMARWADRVLLLRDGRVHDVARRNSAVSRTLRARSG